MKPLSVYMVNQNDSDKFQYTSGICFCFSEIIGTNYDEICKNPLDKQIQAIRLLSTVLTRCSIDSLGSSVRHRCVVHQLFSMLGSLNTCLSEGGENEVLDNGMNEILS